MDESKLFPAQYAEFFTNHEPGKPAHELLVVDRRTRFPGGVVKGTATVQYREYNGSLGAHCLGWMKEDGATDTPEGVFAHLILDSLPERQLVRIALVRFSKIEECAWARLMLDALDKLDGKYRDDED